MQGKHAGLYPSCVLPPWPFYGQISEEKKLILMKRVRNDSLSRGFGKNGQEIYFLRWFCAPGSEPWLGRAAMLGDGEMLWVPCRWKWLGWCRSLCSAPSQPLLLPQPCQAAPAGNGNGGAGAMWWLSIKHRLWSQLLATSVNIRTWLLFKPHCSRGGSNESVGIFQRQADMKCSAGVTHTLIFVLSP